MYCTLSLIFFLFIMLLGHSTRGRFQTRKSSTERWYRNCSSFYWNNFSIRKRSQVPRPSCKFLCRKFWLFWLFGRQKKYLPCHKYGTICYISFDVKYSLLKHKFSHNNVQTAIVDRSLKLWGQIQPLKLWRKIESLKVWRQIEPFKQWRQIESLRLWRQIESLKLWRQIHKLKLQSLKLWRQIQF